MGCEIGTAVQSFVEDSAFIFLFGPAFLHKNGIILMI
jgi:hypothetical protein